MDYSKQTWRVCVSLALIALAFASAAKADGENLATLVNGSASKDDVMVDLLGKLIENYDQAGKIDNRANIAAKVKDLTSLLENKTEAKSTEPARQLPAANPPTADPNSALLISLLERLNQNMERAAQQNVPTQSFVQSPSNPLAFNSGANPSVPTCETTVVDEMDDMIGRMDPDLVQTAYQLKLSVLGGDSVNKFKYFVDGAVVPQNDWNNGLLDLLDKKHGNLKLYEGFEGCHGFMIMYNDASSVLVPLCRKVHDIITPQVSKVIQCFPQLRLEDQYKEALKNLEERTIEWIQISKLCSATSNLDKLVRNARELLMKVAAETLEHSADPAPFQLRMMPDEWSKPSGGDPSLFQLTMMAEERSKASAGAPQKKIPTAADIAYFKGLLKEYNDLKNDVESSAARRTTMMGISMGGR